MIARRAKTRPAHAFEVAQVGKAALLRTHTNAIRKDAGDEECVIADVGPQFKIVPVIGALQGQQHFKKIIQRLRLPVHAALRALDIRILGQNFRDIISNHPVIDSTAPQYVPYENVKIKVRREGEAAAMFEHGLKQFFIIENLIATLGIGKKPRDAIDVARRSSEVRDDEINIRGCELHSTIRLNDFHTGFLFTCRLFGAAIQVPRSEDSGGNSEVIASEHRQLELKRFNRKLFAWNV